MYEITLEQEPASIMVFALRYAGDPNPYYDEVPAEFKFPAMFFQQPEIGTGGDTFATYASDYVMYVNVMAETTAEAWNRGRNVLTALKKARNYVPLIGEDGIETGKNLRLKDPSLKKIDSGVVQLTIEWTSRRPYDRTEPPMMLTVRLGIEEKQGG